MHVDTNPARAQVNDSTTPFPRASVLIVEDDWPVAIAVQRQLQRAGLQVPDPTVDGADAVRRVSREHPDLVLIDIVLAGDVDGLQVAERIRRTPPYPPVVFLTGSSDPATLTRACEIGAVGYVVKPFQGSQLMSAVMLGLSLGRTERRYRADRERALAALQEMTEHTAAEPNPLRAPGPSSSAAALLSRREQEIVRLLAAHYRPRAVGQALDISYYTVKNHLKRIFRKLGVSSQAELLAVLCEPDRSSPAPRAPNS
jgi:DNA-binding NarL/FixJ family response regulator